MRDRHRYLSAPERFNLSHVPVTESGCWLWMYSTCRDGYGNFMADGKPIRAHRYALEQKLGRPINKGMQCCHTCDVPSCVNPAHLFEGTHQDNVSDKVMKGRQPRGERHAMACVNRCQGVSHHNAKLTVDSVRAIRESPLTYKELSRIYGIAQGNIKKVIERKTWKSVQ